MSLNETLEKIEKLTRLSKDYNKCVKEYNALDKEVKIAKKEYLQEKIALENKWSIRLAGLELRQKKLLELQHSLKSK